MRIAMLSSSVSRRAGGVFDAVAGLSDALAARHHAVTVLGLNDEFTEADRERWGQVGLKTSEAIGPRAFGFSPGLSRALRGTATDVVHCHGLWMYPSTLTRAFASRREIPYVITPHGMLDSWALNNSALKKKLAYWAVESANLRNAGCIHALCDAEAQAIRALGLKTPICVLPNGIESTPPPAARAPEWRSDEFSGKKILLYLGRLHPKKGLTMLLQAWAASEARPGWHLVIAGWDQENYRARLEATARALGIDDSISFVGPQFGDAKLSCFAAADAFVLPSFSEGVPMVVLEAWRESLPVLITTACNLPEGEKSGAAICVRPELADLTSGLAKILSMPDEQRNEMARRGRELVERVFDWARVAEAMTDVYDWLAGQSDRPACVHLD